ncbi:MAG: hypothetical protein Q9163_006333 [Psora crenata]
MAPANPHIISQLRQLIYYHLDCNLVRNALFFAGRLLAYDTRSPEAAYLLALCHLRLGQLKAAYDNSKNAGSRGTHLGCSYVLAQACLGLERYVEGVTALDRCKGLWAMRNTWGKHTDTRRQHLPDAAAVYCLQGKLWQAYAEHQKSIECYAEALKVNPFMWDAFTALCDLGAHVRMPNIFKMTPEMMSFLSDPSPEQMSLGALDETSPNPIPHAINHIPIVHQPPSNTDPFSVSKNRLNGEVRNHAGNSALYKKLNSSRNVITPIEDKDMTEDTPAGNGGIMDPAFFTGKGIGDEPPLAPARKARALPGMGLDLAADAPPKMRTNATARPKSRSILNSEDQEEKTLSRSSTQSNGGVELKRTVSGKLVHPPPAASKPSSAAGADQGAPPQPRKSVRLLNQLRPQTGKFSASANAGSLKEDREMRKAKAPSAKGRSVNSFTVGRVVSGNRKHGEPMEPDGKEQRQAANSNPSTQLATQKPTVNEKARELEALQWLLDLLMKLGTGYFALSHFQCQDALRMFQSITPNQRDTPWVLALIGRAHYEQASYAEAEKIFTRIRTITPSRLEDMEYYSTSLWHLKNDIDLAFLAHELIELDRSSPEAWCAVGNSFSLQREHDQALKCFKRATQLDPSFAYAYTLQGHEHVANEEYDKAMSAYRASITAENRHYNAWYGLGKVFEKQGKYPIAEHHYRTAASINPTNAVLITCIGVVLEKQNNPKAALVKYSEACQLADRNALPRFKKAKVLMALGQPERALVELKVLKDIAPDEANVHFSLGRVYKVLRQKGEAIRHFTLALNLDPKASHYIKEAMEQIEDGSDDEDGDM